MKNLTKIKFLILTVISVSFFISCSTSPSTPVSVAPPGTAIVPVVPPVASDMTITGLVRTNPNLSTLAAALARVDLASTLQATGPFTFFAPNNYAFTKLFQERGYGGLNDVPVAMLKEILLNHITSGSITSTSFVNNSYIKSFAKGNASNTNTLSLLVRVSDRVSLNNVSSFISTGNGTTFNIVASNGIIHTVDSIIHLPTIDFHLNANQNFSTFVTALNRPGYGINFINSLNGNINTSYSPFTVFAPTNGAFTEVLGFYNYANLAAVDSVTLEKVLKYHIILNNNLLANLFPFAPTPQNNLLNEPFSIGTSGGAKIKDSRNRFANIIATDIQCSNGVIHILDKVLVPN